MNGANPQPEIFAESGKGLDPSHFEVMQTTLPIHEQTLSQAESRLKLFKSMATRINAGLGMKPILDRTLREVHRLFPTLRISYNQVSEQMISSVISSVTPEMMVNVVGCETDLGEPLARAFLEELRSGQTILVDDLQCDERFG